MRYTEIQSGFIKSMIKGRPYSQREYIDNLMKIEGLALGRRYGMTTGHMFLNFPRMYPVEWKAIWMELNAEGYARMQKDKEEKLEQDLDKLEARQNRKDWVKAGGVC